MNAREFADWIDRCNAGTPAHHGITDQEWRMLRDACRLLAAAERNDGTTRETDDLSDSEDPDLTEYGHLVRMRDHARSLERSRDGLAAEVRRLRGALVVARGAIAHDVPDQCWATGPLTGDPIRDLVVCPGCGAIKRIDEALDARRKP